MGHTHSGENKKVKPTDAVLFPEYLKIKLRKGQGSETCPLKLYTVAATLYEERQVNILNITRAPGQ